MSIFKTSNIKKEVNDFILSYKKHLETYSKLDSPWLPLHPIIQQFKQEISLALFVNGNNTKEFENVKREFERSFEDRVDSHLYKDQSLEKFREISFADFHEDKLMIYLDFLIKDYHGYFENKIISTNNKFTDSPIYIEDRKSAEVPIEDWNKSDREIYQDYKNEVKNADDILKSFLESKTKYGPQKSKLLIGAPFGVGKTSLVKKLAYSSARRSSDYAKEYIPIIIF